MPSFRINYDRVTLANIAPIEKVPNSDNAGSWKKSEIIIKWVEVYGRQDNERTLYRKIEVLGNDACDILQGFTQGDIVDIQAKLGGNMWQNLKTREWYCFNKDALESMTKSHSKFDDSYQPDPQQAAPDNTPPPQHEQPADDIPF